MHPNAIFKNLGYKGKCLILLVLLSHFFSDSLCAENLPSMRALRTQTAPKIDGVLNDDCWKNVPSQSNFKISEPNWGAETKEKTEVKIIYDNQCIYISAMMYDNHPDSISQESGNRDDDVNADYLGVGFDTYNNRQDAFVFVLYASGVQEDFKFSDRAFDAVWESATQINGMGWAAEMRIPYSALRFPDSKEQVWVLNFRREIFRRKEIHEWALTPRGLSNPLLKIGSLQGIEDIKPPVRLSLTPYVSGLLAKIPSENTSSTHGYTYSYGAGADVKYGINDQLTLDVTLLPDFSQVQSDNKVKNLGPFEVKYDENRFFFKENADLFSKGTLFYSRRIGKTPSGYATVEDSLKQGEEIEKNPSQAKLFNASKLSGRTRNGLGIGILNAITQNEYALIKDSLGNHREILTEPLTNYNMLVLDQQFKNNSSAYFSNANTLRNGKYDDSNVSAMGLLLTNKKNIYEITARGAVSQHFQNLVSENPVKKNDIGYKYHYGFEKVSGNFLFLAEHNIISNNYYPADLGIQTNYDFNNIGVSVGYNFLTPNKAFRYWNNNLKFDYSKSFTTGKNTESYLNYSGEMLLSNLWMLYLDAGFTPRESNDYFESRIRQKVYVQPKNYYSHIQIESNSRKRFILKGGFQYGNYYDALVKNPQYETDFNLYYRHNNHLSFTYTFRDVMHQANIGWCDFNEKDEAIFGDRKRSTITNLLTARYVLKLNMSLDLKVRHYWDRAYYNHYYKLEDDGKLSQLDYYDNSRNFDYTLFNIDLGFNWVFAPGSTLSIVYKNFIENEKAQLYSTYYSNIYSTLQGPQTNSISLKLLYFIDYLYFTKRN